MSDLEQSLDKVEQTYGPGSVLKAKREEYEWAIESVAQALHLSTSHIKSIEADRYEDLPGSTYVIGYWRSYARLLGIDIEDTIEANKRRLQVVQPKSSGINVNGGRIPKPDQGKGWGWLLLSVLILAGLAYAWKSGLLDPEKIAGTAGLETSSVITSDAPESGAADEAGSVLRNVGQSVSSGSSGDLAASDSSAQQATSGQALTLSDLGSTTIATEPAAAGALIMAEPITAEDQAQAAEASDTDLAPETASQTGTESSAASESDAAAVAAASTPEENANSLQLSLDKDSWLDVRDKSNKRLIYRSGKAGESIELLGDPPFYVYIGTPDGVKITYLNKNVPFTAHQSGLFARFKLGEALENL